MDDRRIAVTVKLSPGMAKLLRDEENARAATDAIRRRLTKALMEKMDDELDRLYVRGDECT